MLKQINYILLGILVLIGCGVCFGAEGDEGVDYPYRAKITGDNVYIRSGSAEMYYFTGQLDKGDEIVVVDKRFSWCKILPPEGSFSWIAKEFVEIDKNNPSVGIVKSDRDVWAGTAHLDPEDSTTEQVKLHEGDKVTLLGEEKRDYYKIAPPTGAYLWVKDDYVKYIGPAEVETVKVEEKKAAEERPEVVKEPAKEPVKEEVKEDAKPEPIKKDETPDVVVREPVKPKMTPEEMVRVKQVYELIKEVDIERAKELSEQDYTQLKAKLKEIVADEKAGKAVKYARYQLDRIEGYELAKEVAVIIGQGDEELIKLRAEIAAKRKAVHDKVKLESGHALEGVIRASKIYDSKNDEQRYIILDDEGSILCYAKAGAGVSGIDMMEFVGHKVGLKGNFTADAVSGISLMEVDAIEVIE